MALASRSMRYVGGHLRVTLWPLALAVGVLSLAIARRDPEGSFGGISVLSGIAELAGGWSLAFLGLVFWARHRRNGFGPLLVAAGFAWFLREWANADRVLLSLAYAGAVVVLGFLPTAVFDPPAQGCFDCPKNLILVGGDQSLS